MAQNRTLCAVIDASAIISALLSNYDFSRNHRRHGRLVLTEGLTEPLHLESARRRYLDLLASIPTKLVTSHGLAEAYRLRDFSMVNAAEYRTISTDLLLQWNIAEEHVTLSSICESPDLRKCISWLGLTDVALIRLAQRFDCPLITEDERLLADATRLGVECRLVKNLIPPA